MIAGVILGAESAASAQAAVDEHRLLTFDATIEHPDEETLEYSLQCAPPYEIVWTGDYQGTGEACRFLQSRALPRPDCDPDGAESDVARLSVREDGALTADGEQYVESLVLDRRFPCHRVVWDNQLVEILPPAASQDEFNIGTYHGTLFVDGEQQDVGIGLRYEPGDWVLDLRDGNALASATDVVLGLDTDRALLRFDTASGRPLPSLAWNSDGETDALAEQQLCQLLCESGAAAVRYTRVGDGFEIAREDLLLRLQPNTLPEIQSIAVEGQLVTVAAIDEDGDQLSYRIRVRRDGRQEFALLTAEAMVDVGQDVLDRDEIAVVVFDGAGYALETFERSGDGYVAIDSTVARVGSNSAPEGSDSSAIWVIPGVFVAALGVVVGVGMKRRARSS